MAERADANRGAGAKAQARAEVRGAAAAVLGTLGGRDGLAEREPAHHQDVATLANLARFAGQLRGGTKRDPRTRELEGSISPEAPARLAEVLGQLLAAMEVLGP